MKEKVYEIYKIYDDLVQECKLLFSKNRETWYTKEMRDEVELTAITYPEYYAVYLMDTKRIIERYLNGELNYDKTIVGKTLDKYIQIINRRKSDLSLNNLGTTLNFLKYLHGDIKISFERNKI